MKRNKKYISPRTKAWAIETVTKAIEALTELGDYPLLVQRLKITIKSIKKG